VCVPLIWGGTFIAGRLVSAQLPPSIGAFSRYVIAVICLLGFWLVMQRSKVGSSTEQLFSMTRAEWAMTIALGATGILIYNLFFFAALAQMPASRTSIFVALNPTFTIVFSVLLFKERLSALRWVGVVFALMGVWIVVTRGDLSKVVESFGKGELLMMVAVFSWAFYTLIGRHALKTLSPIKATLWASIWGTLMLGVFTVGDWSKVSPAYFTPTVIASSVFLGALGTAVAFVWYYQGVKLLGSSRTVIFNTLVPIFGVLLGWLILNEPMSASLLIGGSIAVTGIYLVNRN
jgi:drug/metabolite transporter (DMT)-like permease